MGARYKVTEEDRRVANTLRGVLMAAGQTLKACLKSCDLKPRRDMSADDVEEATISLGLAIIGLCRLKDGQTPSGERIAALMDMCCEWTGFVNAAGRS